MHSTLRGLLRVGRSAARLRESAGARREKRRSALRAWTCVAGAKANGEASNSDYKSMSQLQPTNTWVIRLNFRKRQNLQKFMPKIIGKTFGGCISQSDAHVPEYTWHSRSDSASPSRK